MAKKLPEVHFYLTKDFEMEDGQWKLKEGVVAKRLKETEIVERVDDASIVKMCEELAEEGVATKSQILQIHHKDIVLAVHDDGICQGEEKDKPATESQLQKRRKSEAPASSGLERKPFRRCFTYTNKAKTCDWSRYGIKIHFPDNALPPGEKNCDVSISPFMIYYSEFKLPDNTELVSGIYSITSTLTKRFVKPLLVEIQHCARLTDNSRFKFVIATRTRSRPIKFETVDHGKFDQWSRYGQIELTHFSDVGIVAFCRRIYSQVRQRISRWTRTDQVSPETQDNYERWYSSKVFYIIKGDNSWEVHLVIIPDLNICLQDIESHYSASGANYGPQQQIKIEGEEVLLEVPTDGTEQEGWRITPLSHPAVRSLDIWMIRKQQVDNYQPGNLIPSCTLQIKWTKDSKQAVSTIYTLKLRGAAAPFNYFKIICEPVQKGTTTAYPLPEIELLALMRIDLHMKVGTHYNEFGTFLLQDHTGQKVRNMAHKFNNDSNLINTEIIREWLEGRGRRPVTWKILIEVLREIQLHTLADEIEQTQAKCLQYD